MNFSNMLLNLIRLPGCLTDLLVEVKKLYFQLQYICTVFNVLFLSDRSGRLLSSDFLLNS